MATIVRDDLQAVVTAAAKSVASLPTTQSICCPNCGSAATRSLLEQWGSTIDVQQTECPSCDYLMVTSVRTGRVLEAYAPGLWAR
jgi:predicted RNA-binding Zn-ribbon protein involved in translation (DUF1610 family)